MAVLNGKPEKQTGNGKGIEAGCAGVLVAEGVDNRQNGFVGEWLAVASSGLIVPALEGVHCRLGEEYGRGHQNLHVVQKPICANNGVDRDAPCDVRRSGDLRIYRHLLPYDLSLLQVRSIAGVPLFSARRRHKHLRILIAEWTDLTNVELDDRGSVFSYYDR